MDNVDIIVISQQNWDGKLGSNCKNIAIEFAKKSRVLYVNPALDRITLLRNRRDPEVRRRRKLMTTDNLVQVQPNLWVLYPDVVLESINWLSSYKLFSMLNKRNNRMLAKSIRRVAKKLNFEQFVLFNDNEMFRGFHLREYLTPRLSIYYIRDYMLGVAYWKRHGERMEPLLIKKSDLCVANSEYLARYARQYNEHALNVGQGCDQTLFVGNRGHFNLPVDVAEIKGTRIGYVGALNAERLDIAIIDHVARALPDCNIVLVGPQDGEFLKSGLHSLPNVFFLGQKNERDLPAYIGAFDVCLNPQQLNVLTIGNYPRKIDEYLLLGKPVVATFTETMEMFSDHVYLADTKESYVALIKKALEEDTGEVRQARIAFASTHTWENSTNQIRAAMLAKVISDQV